MRQDGEANGTNGTNGTEDGTVDAMGALERQARAPVGFVAASTGPEGGNIKPPQQPASKPAVVENSDAIDIDELL